MKTLLYTLVFATLTTMGLKAQTTGVAINATGSPSDPSAMLDISSSDKGILIPRMTESQKNSISSPAQGLMVYQNDGQSGYWYFDGSSWKTVGDNLGNHTAISDLDMSNNKITNLTTCTSNLDAANKEYVDNAVGAGGGGPTLADTTYMLCGAKLLPVAYGGTTYTVPAGKMWAIESAIYSSYDYPVRISAVNGLSYSYAYIGNYSYSGNLIYCIATPYVLPAGTVVTFNVGNSSSQKGLVSIREYKLVVQ